jgi:hypothetical protein
MAERVSRSIEAFDLLANDIRLEILRTLGEATANNESIPMAFSELQRRVNVSDNGRFNYHLSKLLGNFAEKTDEGYELRPQGMRIYQAIISGAYTDEGKVGPEYIEGEFCNDCKVAAEAWYDNSHFHLGCTECGKLIMHYPIPPGSFENGDPESMIEAASAWILRDHISASQGVCPYCAGTVDVELSGDESEMDPLGKRKYRGVVSYICRRCSWEFYCNPPFAMTIHPLTVGFFAEHDIDIFARHPWAIYPDAEEKVLSTDPWRVEITYCVDGAQQRMVIDENAEIVKTGSPQ